MKVYLTDLNGKRQLTEVPCRITDHHASLKN